MSPWVAVSVKWAEDWLLLLLNSNFITALAGAAAGAWAGAYAVQKIAARESLRSRLLAEIRSTNTGIRLAGSICNTCIVMKKQHVKALKENYDIQKSELSKLREVAANDPQKTTFKFLADFKSLPPVTIPAATLETLQKIIFERSDFAKAATLAPTLIQSLDLLNAVINERNRFIEEMRTGEFRNNHKRVAELYFGLRDDSGHTDERYGSTLKGIASYTDDCIHFSKSICDDLMGHANALQSQFKEAFKKEKVKIVNFGIAEPYQEYLPDPTQYPGWDKIQ